MTARGPHPLRGREAELAVLRRRIELLAGGTGGVLVVEGPAGSGKTRLLAEATAGAPPAVRVFAGAGQAAALGMPAWLLLDTLTTGGDPPADPAVLRRDTGFWLVQGLHEGLERAALATPVLIVLDDFHWADLATAGAVRALARRLAADPVLWVLALRPPAPAGGEGAGLLRLAPLHPAAVAEVARDVLGGRPDQRLSEMLAGTHGNPLLLHHLLHGLRDERAVRLRDGVAELSTGRVPQRFRDAIRARVGALSPDGRSAVELASVLGRSCTADQLARMLGRSPAALLAPLREVLDADLLAEQGDRLAFRHDLVRDAVESGLPGPLRRALRRQAVEVSLAAGTPAADVAALVLQTAGPGDSDGIALLRRAAAEIVERAPAVAAQLSSHALGLARPGDPARDALLVDAVTHLVLAGRIAEATELFRRYDSPALDRITTARLRQLLADVLMPSDPDHAAGLCREALSYDGLPDDLRARLYASLSTALSIGGRPGEARTAARAAPAVADPLVTSAVLTATAVADFHGCHWAAGLRTADEALRRRSALAGARGLWLPDTWKAMMLDASGRLDDARRLADEGARLAQRDGQLATARLWSVLRARILLRAGRLDEARAEAEAIQAMSYELGSRHFLHFAARILGLVALHRGDQAGMAVARAAAARMSAESAPGWHGRGQWLRALLDEAAGSPPGDWTPDERMDEPYAGCVRVVVLAEHADVATLVRLLLRAGLRERAEAAVERLADESRRHAGEPVVAAALCHASGVLTADPARLTEAVALHAADPRLLLRARVTEDAGAAVLAADRPLGLELLDSALDRWTAVGADRDAARVRGLLRRHGVRRRAPHRPRNGWAGLTESETRVARLVAAGHTNRQIAEELFLSPHTVSTHLRHAFVKLGVRSRTELARIVPD
ncbi:helix-turn-helix transcriptional regulator [Actinoplanes sp. RD1]|uniref:helix-turn-helix transcriptional regulator n=1 Tax=Actinoplanes sp. RD1 TaxID=3064538 RepID=UPI002741EBF5|nr:LuxR family transcriptional regulator [Actinoplanes sp. RD1]